MKALSLKNFTAGLYGQPGRLCIWFWLHWCSNHARMFVGVVYTTPMVFGRLNNLLGKDTRGAMSALQMLLALPAASLPPVSTAEAMTPPPTMISAMTADDAPTGYIHALKAPTTEEALTNALARIYSAKQQCGGLDVSKATSRMTSEQVREMETALGKAAGFLAFGKREDGKQKELEELIATLMRFATVLEEDIASCQTSQVPTQ